MTTNEFPVLLRAILENKYFPVNLRVRSPLTRKQYHFALDNLEEFLRRPPELSDLSDDSVCGMMAMLLARDLSPATVNDRRIRINALWGWLAKRGHVKFFPTNYPIDEPEPDPKAWSRDEMKRLLDAARHFEEGFDRKNLWPWWHALFSVVWDSGARTGEILAARWEWLDWRTGILRIPHTVRKGKRKSAIYRLKELSLGNLKILGVQSEGIIFNCGSENAYYKRYRKLLERAGIPRNRKNGLQKWRRSYATYLTLLGGDATKDLLHDDVRTTKRSYLDRSILNTFQNHLLFPLGSVEDSVG